MPKLYTLYVTTPNRQIGNVTEDEVKRFAKIYEDEVYALDAVKEILEGEVFVISHDVLRYVKWPTWRNSDNLIKLLELALGEADQVEGKFIEFVNS